MKKRENFYSRSNYVTLPDMPTPDTTEEAEYNDETPETFESEKESDIRFINDNFQEFNVSSSSDYVTPEPSQGYSDDVIFGTPTPLKYDSESEMIERYTVPETTYSEDDVVFLSRNQIKDSEAPPRTTFCFGTGSIFRSDRNPGSPFARSPEENK